LEEIIKVKKKGGCKDYRPYSPLAKSEKFKMVNHCQVLLGWASKHRNSETSITEISNATGIPRMCVHWILKDYKERRVDSTLARVARSFGYDFMVYRNWNIEAKDKYKRRKKIIDAVKICDPTLEKDY
jgi:hypothetical protein